MVVMMIIFCLYYSIVLLPLRGKEFEELTNSQRARLEKEHSRYLRSLRGKRNPMSSKEFLKTLQNMALLYLFSLIFFSFAYIGIIIYIFFFY